MSIREWRFWFQVHLRDRKGDKTLSPHYTGYHQGTQLVPISSVAMQAPRPAHPLEPVNNGYDGT